MPPLDLDAAPCIRCISSEPGTSCTGAYAIQVALAAGGTPITSTAAYDAVQRTRAFWMAACFCGPQATARKPTSICAIVRLTSPSAAYVNATAAGAAIHE